MSGVPIPIRRKAAVQRQGPQDWARLTGLKIVMPPPVFPVRATLAMRCALAAQDEGKVVEFSSSCFKAYWSDGHDISQPEVIDAGLRRGRPRTAAAYLSAPRTQTIKDRLRANTDEVIARGGFGSPTMFVNGADMYFGNDRMELVEAALAR